MSDESSVALRILIRATVGSPASGADLANIVTSELPDGAQCFVTGNRILYRFRKFSSAAAASPTVIVPNDGHGRWIAEGPALGAAMAWVVGTEQNSVDTTASANWTAPQTANFSLELGSAAWTFTPAGCILQYHGAPARYLFRMTFSLVFGVSGTIHAGVSRNDDLLLTESGIISGTQFFDFSDSETSGRAFSCERATNVAEGTTIRPKFRATAQDQDLLIERFTLSAVPINAAP